MTTTKTRRRGAELEEALLAAAWEELQAVGYAAMTIEAVADRAGTSRAVLYRRWGNRPDLVIATLRRFRPVLSGAVPDTGSLRGDVLAVLQRASGRIADIGPETVYGLLGDYLSDPALFSRAQEQVSFVSRDLMGTILERAVARGEARPGLSPMVMTVPIALFRNELFSARGAPREEHLVQAVDEVFLPLVRP